MRKPKLPSVARRSIVLCNGKGLVLEIALENSSDTIWCYRVSTSDG